MYKAPAATVLAVSAPTGDASEATPPRTLSDSLCTQHSDIARSFHRFSIGGERVQQEIVDAAYAAGGTPTAIADRIGAFLGRMRAAAHGDLPQTKDDLEPVRDDPRLWEIKWKLKKRGEYRLYHAEPGAAPELVALRFHRKDTSGPQDDIDARQDAEIAVASRRYAEGATSRWGHAASGCTECLDG